MAWSLGPAFGLGAAGFPAHADSAEKLLQHADAALYRAKHEGRNRVVAWAPQDVAAEGLNAGRP